MEKRNEKIEMLDLMLRPAFCAENGVISHVNQAASQYLLEPGTDIAAAIASGAEEYASFSDGCLYLTLQLGDQQIGASVTRTQGLDIFILEQQAESAELRAMALAAKQLREPLAGMMTVAERMFPSITGDPAAQAQAAQFTRRLFQMQRMLGNMSDAVFYTQADGSRMEYVEMCTFLEEILDKSAVLLAQMHIHLEYALPRDAIYTLSDTEKLERAVYNLLSNAIKHTPDGGTIAVRLQCTGKRLQLSVTDGNPDAARSTYANAFTHYLREPALEDSRNGIGLGMVLVRAAATIHGGAVLIDRVAGVGTRITMTMQLRHPRDGQLRSPILRIDYAGERDHALLELSDVLPASLYRPDAIQ